jgi:hypothetical protein
MPMMVGFSAQRSEALRREVERYAAMMPTLGVDRAVLVGELAVGNVEPTTPVQLVIVQDTDAPFSRRADFFYSHLEPRVALDVTVYTRPEFEELSQSDTPAGRAIRSGDPIFG